MVLLCLLVLNSVVRRFFFFPFSFPSFFFIIWYQRLCNCTFFCRIFLFFPLFLFPFFYFVLFSTITVEVRVGHAPGIEVLGVAVGRCVRSDRKDFQRSDHWSPPSRFDRCASLCMQYVEASRDVIFRRILPPAILPPDFERSACSRHG